MTRGSSQLKFIRHPVWDEACAPGHPRYSHVLLRHPSLPITRSRSTRSMPSLFGPLRHCSSAPSRTVLLHASHCPVTTVVHHHRDCPPTLILPDNTFHRLLARNSRMRTLSGASPPGHVCVRLAAFILALPVDVGLVARSLRELHVQSQRCHFGRSSHDVLRRLFDFRTSAASIVLEGLARISSGFLSMQPDWDPDQLTLLLLSRTVVQDGLFCSSDSESATPRHHTSTRSSPSLSVFAFPHTPDASRLSRHGQLVMDNLVQDQTEVLDVDSGFPFLRHIRHFVIRHPSHYLVRAAQHSALIVTIPLRRSQTRTSVIYHSIPHHTTPRHATSSLPFHPAFYLVLVPARTYTSM